MQFQTKIVEGNKNPKARVVWAGGGLLFLSMIIMCIGGYQRYGLWLFVAAVVVLGVGLVLTKGDADVIDVSAADLVISPEEIRVGDEVYPLSQVSGIEFQVAGYDGMVDPDGYSPRGRYGRRGFLNGMDNYLNFQYGDQQQEWQFYLPDPQQAQQLGALFKELYVRRIPFVERNRTGDRTFLFEPVNEKQLEDRMVVNGYR